MNSGPEKNSPAHFLAADAALGCTGVCKARSRPFSNDHANAIRKLLPSKKGGKMRAAILAALISFAATCVAQNGKFVNDQYKLQKVADGVYTFIAPESDSGVVQSNCTVIIGDDAVLVVDTGQFPSLAQKMIADIKKLTAKPVRYLVNTHWHFDHVWGNGAFRDAYPGLTIISTEFTRDLVNREGPKTIKNQPEVNRKQSAELRKLAADGKLPDGRALPEDYKASLLRLADTLDHVEAEFPLTVHTPPNLGFEKEIEVDLGHRVVKTCGSGVRIQAETQRFGFPM